MVSQWSGGKPGVVFVCELPHFAMFPAAPTKMFLVECFRKQ